MSRIVDFSDGFTSEVAPTITGIVASEVVSTPSGNLSASDVQAALNELQSDIDTINLGTDLTTHLNDTTDAHDASAISSVASGNLSATDVQAALNELQSDIDTRATSSEITNHITDPTDAHTASAITNVPFANLIATDVQGALDELQADIDTRATITSLSSHTADSNDAHPASAISSVASGNLVATDVQAALNELQSELDTAIAHISDATDAHDASAISSVASGNLVATDVQAALNELQSDIDTRALSSDLSNHLSDISDAHDASAISSVASGNLLATDVQAALNELQSDIDTRALASDLSNHLSDTSDAHDASAISSVPSGNLAASDVQAALNELQSDIDTRMSNPMTTGGDVIYGGVSGVPTRLANGTAGQVLTSAGGTAAPSWTTVSATATAAGSDGYIQFNTSNAMDAEANLYWDKTNNNLGIGTSSPNYTGFSGSTTTTASAAASGGNVELASLAADAASVITGSLSYIMSTNTSATDKRVASIRAVTEGTTANHRGASLQFFTKTDNSTHAERMRITSTGYLGIGTATPQNIVNIAKTATTTKALTDMYLKLGASEATASGTHLIGFGYATTSLTNVPAYFGYINTNNAGNTNGDFVFATRSVTTDTEPTERMRINSSGNIGINQNNPTSLLEVKDASTNTACITVIGDADNTAFTLYGNTTPRLQGFGYGGTYASPTASAANQTLLYLGARGYGTGFTGTKANLSMQAEALWTLTSNPTFIQMSTTPSGSTTLTERMRIDSSGNVGIGLTPTARNNTRLQILDGIGFPATQVSSSDGNTLDDYEEGTWTPSVGGTATYGGSNGGTYTKTGNRVNFFGTLSISTIGTGSTTVISGLPFACADHVNSICISAFNNLATSVVYLGGYIQSAGSSVIMSTLTAAATATGNAAVIGSSTTIYMSGSYKV